MTIPPVASRYPDDFDGDDNLLVVHDHLKVRLMNDYSPGDTTVLVESDASGFPPEGFITLTDNLSDLTDRAVCLHYSSRDSAGFYGIELEDGFVDVDKPRHETWVTMNVRADHHNRLVSGLIAAQRMAGRKGVIDLRPLGDTLEGRINFLRKLALRPRAWFVANRRIGIVPFTVVFTNLSFRDPTYWAFDFGDGTSITSDDDDLEGITVDAEAGTVTKEYSDAGTYDVALVVSNANGDDSITIPNYITARIKAPDEATVSFVPDNATQAYIDDILYTRTAAVVDVSVTDSGEQVGDAIVSYNWNFGDDLGHGNSSSTKAQYSIGGVYDLILQTSTLLGAYRNTIFPNKINVIERNNLWLMTFADESSSVTKDVKSYEFGLISETFKTSSRTAQSVTRNASMVNDGTAAARKVREYRRNNCFAPTFGYGSGDKNKALVFWTEGEHSGSVGIRFKQYQGFLDAWTTPPGLDVVDRGWNWVSLVSPTKAYLLFGTNGLPAATPPGTSPTNQTRQEVDLFTLTVSTTAMDETYYRNGAEELEQNTGLGSDGNYSVYRSCFKGNNGYIARNAGVGTYFRIKSFYRSEGTLAQEFLYLRKLPDIPGSVKLEGQLVPLSTGIFYFDNSGEVVAYGTLDGTWRVAGPGANTSPFRTLQDKAVADYDSTANTLLASSDGDSNAYLSYDYSTNVFLKFNSIDRTFRAMVARPDGEQFLLGQY